jgi:hypothetical protein
MPTPPQLPQISHSSLQQISRDGAAAAASRS